MDILDQHNNGLRKFKKDPILLNSRSFYYTLQCRGYNTTKINEGLVDSFEFAYREVVLAASKLSFSSSNRGVEYIISKVSNKENEALCVHFLDGERVSLVR